jgi:hypothetical protein
LFLVTWECIVTNKNCSSKSFDPEAKNEFLMGTEKGKEYLSGLLPKYRLELH